MENYMEIQIKNNIVTIANDNEPLNVPLNTIKNITKYTNDQEDTCALLVFIRDMVSSYNNYVQIENERNKSTTYLKFNYSPAFMEIFCTMILSMGFNTDQIISALSEFSPYELFGSCVEDGKIEYILDRVVRITEKVKQEIVRYNDTYILDDDDEIEKSKVKRYEIWN